MKHTKSSLMVTLFACMGYGKKHYTKASVDALRGLLKQYHSIEAERRWTFGCLRCLENTGLIQRKQRYRNDENGEIRQISSMISFTFKGVRYLAKMGVRGAKKLLDSMISWHKKKDRRFPRPETEIEKFSPLEAEENLRRLRELAFST